MKRILGKLGLKPFKSNGIGHSGKPGNHGGPEYYLNDRLNLNIVYSVYHTPRTLEEIAEELGMTPVFIEDRIDYLEGNGFLVRCPGNRFTTYVIFDPQTYSRELFEQHYRKRLEVANLLTQEYVPLVREAVADMKDVYIPGGNRELLEATAILYGIIHKCFLFIEKDLSKYRIKTTDGGDYFVQVETHATPSDPDYKQTQFPQYRVCGPMTRESAKYPSVYSWSLDSIFCSREGRWENNLFTDYEYLYELMTGTLVDNVANQEKFQRLKERKFITDDYKVNIMVMKGKLEDFFEKLPTLDEQIKKKYADYALESAMIRAKNYPPQIQDYIISREVEMFINVEVALMVLDILYGNGTFKPLTERERVASNLIMFSDVLPKD